MAMSCRRMFVPIVRGSATGIGDGDLRTVAMLQAAIAFSTSQAVPAPVPEETNIDAAVPVRANAQCAPADMYPAPNGGSVAAPLCVSSACSGVRLNQQAGAVASARRNKGSRNERFKNGEQCRKNEVCCS